MSSDIRKDVDNAVLEEVEGVNDEISELVGRFGKNGGSGGDELGLYEDWMPDSDEHEGKTHITPHQAHALAGMMNLPAAYDLLDMHIEGLDGFLTQLAKDYMKLLPSIEGESRDQQMRVLMAKAGVHADEEQATRALWSRLASNTDNGDE